MEDYKEILRYLQLGTSIPVLQEFESYILEIFESYKVKAILLKKEINNKKFGNLTDNVVGIALLYDDGSNILFFGFCGVYSHEKHAIAFLVDEIIKFGKQNGYGLIRGPVNIPVYIYGWGFMVEGSKKNQFVGSPINPPIYQDIFINKGFYVKFEEDRYAMVAMKFDPYKMKGKDGKPKYNFSEYEYIAPEREDMKQFKEEFIRLHKIYMPPSSQITPKSSINFDSHVRFIFDYGYKGMMWIVRYKPTNEMVGCGYVIPNPFSRDKKGRIDSISFHDWVVHPDHRRSGLAMLMYGETAMLICPNGIKWGSWPVGAENEANGAAARKMGGKKDRTHLILEYNVNLS